MPRGLPTSFCNLMGPTLYFDDEFGRLCSTDTPELCGGSMFGR